MPARSFVASLFLLCLFLGCANTTEQITSSKQEHMLPPEVLRAPISDKDGAIVGVIQLTNVSFVATIDSVLPKEKRSGNEMGQLLFCAKYFLVKAHSTSDDSISIGVIVKNSDSSISIEFPDAIIWVEQNFGDTAPKPEAVIGDGALVFFDAGIERFRTLVVSREIYNELRDTCIDPKTS